MNRILYIKACVNERSRTAELAKHLLGSLNGQVETVDLFEDNLKPLDSVLLAKRDQLLKNNRTDAEIFCSCKTVCISRHYCDSSSILGSDVSGSA